MRVLARTMTIGLAIVGTVLLLSVPPAFAAKASFDQPPTEPPYGLAVQGDRGGTKLYGVIELEYNVNSDGSATVYAVVRLRKGNELKVFFAGPLENVNIQDPLVVQSAVTLALKPDILNSFFGDTTLCVWLKSASDYAKSGLYGNTFFEVMDFEIAVSSCP